MVVKMYYMNTDRDNFHDWARDKPDTTSFSGLHHLERSRPLPQPSLPWRRIGVLIAVAAGLVAGLRYYFAA